MTAQATIKRLAENFNNAVALVALIAERDAEIRRILAAGRARAMAKKSV